MNPIDYSQAVRGDYCETITPSDTTRFRTTPIVGVVCGTPGAVTVVNGDGTTCTFPSNCIVAGAVLPLPRVIGIDSTGTTASEIVGYFTRR